MRSRLLLALGALALLFAPASLAIKNGTTVDEIEIKEIKVRPVRVSKEPVDQVETGEITNKPMKVPRVSVDEVSADVTPLKPVKVGRVTLDGLEDLPKKPSPEDQEIVEQSIQRAEQQFGPAGPDEGRRHPTADRAGNAAAELALSAALAAGESHEQAQADSQAARARVRQDYLGGTPDAGEEVDAGVTEAPGEAAPEVLEPVAVPLDDAEAKPVEGSSQAE